MELADGTLRPARVTFDRVYVKALLDEVDRMRSAVERERNRCVTLVRAQPVSLSWVRDDIIRKISSGE